MIYLFFLQLKLEIVIRTNFESEKISFTTCLLKPLDKQFTK